METRVCRLYGQKDIRIETDPVGEPGSREVIVRMGAGGICGSDLHYFQDGGFGPVRVREPIILGHEIAGTVEAIGDEVTTLRVGDRVAVNPSHPCGVCKFCSEGLLQQCLEMRFMGSAMRLPHEQGGFRDLLVVGAGQCVVIPEYVTIAEAACAEPLAVCLHAARRAGELSGKRVLVTGAGPIGALCVAVARSEGAAEIVATDLQDQTLSITREMGADRTVNVASASDTMRVYTLNKGHFDVAFECSAAPAAVLMAIESVRPQGTIVQVGVTGNIPVPLNLIVGKELDLRGTHRFHHEFADAVALISANELNVKPVITATHPLEEAVLAFEKAGDRSRSMKVQLAFT